VVLRNRRRRSKGLSSLVHKERHWQHPRLPRAE
jgi:hypothetical protein